MQRLCSRLEKSKFINNLKLNSMDIKLIEHLIDLHEKRITPTICNKRHFETNYKSSYIVEYLKGRNEMIKKHESYIGSKVFKLAKSFRYILLNEYVVSYDSFEKKMNPLENEEVIFTEHLYEEFCKEYIQYQIERITKSFVQESITSNSTCKLTNIMFEWELECKQELLKFFNNILEG